MEKTNHKLMDYLLVFSMMFLPVQSAWAMTVMTSSEMVLSAAHEVVHEPAVQLMDVSYDGRHAAMLSDTIDSASHTESHADSMASDIASDMDCADDHCSMCAHLAYILPIELPRFDDHLKAGFVPSSDALLDYLSSPERPTPIHS
ncbi:MAG: hypothetical protein JKY93_06875 [Gammaproteobacteria bacterium]|nr:hypothetical protein [Gammaproteobacteria bacterium]